MKNTCEFSKKKRNAHRASAFICLVCFVRSAPYLTIVGCNKNYDGTTQEQQVSEKKAKDKAEGEEETRSKSSRGSKSSQGSVPETVIVPETGPAAARQQWRTSSSS
jgi:hypothetical protein